MGSSGPMDMPDDDEVVGRLRDRWDAIGEGKITIIVFLPLQKSILPWFPAIGSVSCGKRIWLHEVFHRACARKPRTSWLRAACMVAVDLSPALASSFTANAPCRYMSAHAHAVAGLAQGGQPGPTLLQ